MKSKFKIPAVICYGVFVVSSILMAHLIFMHTPPLQGIFTTTAQLDAYVDALTAINTPYLLYTLYYDFFFMFSIALFGWIICAWFYSEFKFKKGIDANNSESKHITESMQDAEPNLVSAKMVSFIQVVIGLIAVVLAVYLYLDLYENIHLVKRIHGRHLDIEQTNFALKQKLKYILSFSGFIVLYILAIYRSVLVARKEKRKNKMLVNNLLVLAGHCLLILIGMGIIHVFHFVF
jgi:hypothetical protein